MQYKNNEVECLFGQLLKYSNTISDVYLLIIFFRIYRDFHIAQNYISM